MKRGGPTFWIYVDNCNDQVIQILNSLYFSGPIPRIFTIYTDKFLCIEMHISIPVVISSKK